MTNPEPHPTRRSLSAFLLHPSAFILHPSSFLLLLALALPLRADTNEVIERVSRRFTPDKPAVKVSYSVAYRFLGLELRQLATATITAVEGAWQAPDSTASRPACLISFRLDSLERSRQATRGSKRGIILHNHILAILTFPDLDAILYAKRADEDIRVFAHRKSANNYEIYDLDSGEFRYRGFDYLTDTISTNLVGAAELTRQGKEVCRFLKIIYDAHQAQVQTQALAVAAATNPPVFLYTEGDLVPFDIKLSRGRTPSSILGARLDCLYLKAKPGAKAGGKGRNLELWALPFLEVAQHKGDDDMVALARQTLQWSMVPLVTDLGLSLGCIRGSLTSLELVPLADVDVNILSTP